jgi:hypothetical protein
MHEIAKFSAKTATGPLRRHLYDHHLDEWVSQCDHLHIEITARDAQDAVESYRKSKGQAGKQSRLSYYKEAFENALVEFIVGDDQVCGLCASLSCCS